MTKKFIVSVIVALVIGFVLGYVSCSLFTSHSTSLGAQVQNDSWIFTGGVYAGSNATQVIDTNGNLVGPISSSNTASISGATTLSGTTAISGALTISGTAAVSQTSSSTLKIGNNASGLGVGCLVLGDSGGATSSPVYITATGTTISATTTKPAICK